MTRYVLDTNSVSYLVRDHPAVARRMSNTPVGSICVSAITEGELRFGLARRPDASQLARSIDEFLRRVDILPWDSQVAGHYASLRARLERSGRGVGALDLRIAAHAVAINATLVTSDKVLHTVPGITVEDWTLSS